MKDVIRKCWLALPALLFFSTISLNAQEVQLRAVIGGGGVHVDNGTHTINATLGQPIIGTTHSAQHLLSQGFWNLSTNQYVLSPVDDSPVAGEIPSAPLMLRCSPNPVSTTAVVEIDIAQSERIRLSLVDLLGREVVLLFHGKHETGKLSLPVDTEMLAAGHYQLHLISESDHVTLPIVVVR